MNRQKYQQAQQRLHQYIGAFIGSDYTQVGNIPIVSDEISDIMPTESILLSTIEECLQRNIPISETLLHDTLEAYGVNDIDATMKSVLNMPDDGLDLETRAFIARRWLSEYRSDWLSDSINRIMSDTDMSYVSRIDRAINLMQRNKVSTDTEVSLNQIDAIGFFEQHHADLVERYRKGAPIGFQLPFREMRDNIGSLNSGETTLIIGPTGSGKSLVGDHMAEYFAWMQGGINVDIFSVETQAMVMVTRMLARNLNVPWRALTSGAVDIRQYDFYDKFRRRVESYTEHRGQVHRYYDHNYSTSEIASRMIAGAHAARSADRYYVAILDVLQNVRYTGSPQDRHQQLERINMDFINAVRTCAAITPSHGVLIAHESGSGETGEAWGSRMVKKQHQLVLQISRDKLEEPVDSDRPIMDPKTGSAALDALGNVMLYMRRGETHSNTIRISTVKANNTAKAAYDLHLIGEYSRIQE